jgi:hypothetical protein
VQWNPLLVVVVVVAAATAAYLLLLSAPDQAAQAAVQQASIAECRNPSQEAEEEESQTLRGTHSSSSLATHVESSSEGGIIKEAQTVF